MAVQNNHRNRWTHHIKGWTNAEMVNSASAGGSAAFGSVYPSIADWLTRRYPGKMGPHLNPPWIIGGLAGMAIPLVATTIRSFITIKKTGSLEEGTSDYASGFAGVFIAGISAAVGAHLGNMARNFSRAGLGNNIVGALIGLGVGFGIATIVQVRTEG